MLYLYFKIWDANTESLPPDPGTRISYELFLDLYLSNKTIRLLSLSSQSTSLFLYLAKLHASQIPFLSKLIVGLVAKFDPRGNESPLTYKLFDETKVVLKSTKFCSEIEVYTSLPLLVRIIEEERLSNPGSL